MATGVVFAGEISQSAAEVIYTPGAGITGVCNVSFVNKGSSSVSIRLGYSGSATTSASFHIEYDRTLPPRKSFERTAIVLSGTQTLIAEVGTASAVNVTVWSVESTL